VIETFTRAYFGRHRVETPSGYFRSPNVGGVRGDLHDLSGEGCRTCSTPVGSSSADAAFSTRGTRGVGIDGEEWSGFAFGFGIDRCAQMRHEIADMRALIENDTRFLEQFS